MALRYWHGAELSRLFYRCGRVDTSTALIQVNEDGSVNLSTSVSENGQGYRPPCRSLPPKRLVLGLKRFILASRQRRSLVMADPRRPRAERWWAAGRFLMRQKIKRRILSVVGDTHGACELADTLWSGGLIINRHDPSRRIDFKRAVNKTKWASVSLTEYGWFVPPPIHWDEEKAAAVRTLPGVRLSGG